MTVYALLFFEFFKIGLFALGGGLVTVPFLFDLSTRYPWFTSEQLVNMIAVAESFARTGRRQHGDLCRF